MTETETETAAEPAPRVQLSLDNISPLRFVYTVADAPLTHRMPPRRGHDMEIWPERIEIALRLEEDHRTWYVAWANLDGPWKTNRGERSATSTNIFFSDPIGEKAEVVPKWVRDACVRTLDTVNATWGK